MTEKQKAKWKSKREKGHCVGWKVLTLRRGKLYPRYKGYRALPIGKWLMEERRRPCDVEEIPCYDIDDTPYPFGFHIYLSKVSVNVFYGEVCRKVYFRKPVAWGYQNWHNRSRSVVVAKELFIPSEKENP